MDFVSIGTSAILSAILFIALEFSIILPLFKKIVIGAINSEVIPSLSKYIDDKTGELVSVLTKSLVQKFKGYLGGTRKGTSAIIERLMRGEDPDDIEDDYADNTWAKAMDLIDTSYPLLHDFLTRTRKSNSDKEKEYTIEGIREG